MRDGSHTHTQTKINLIQRKEDLIEVKNRRILNIIYDSSSHLERIQKVKTQSHSLVELPVRMMMDTDKQSGTSPHHIILNDQSSSQINQALHNINHQFTRKRNQTNRTKISGSIRRASHKDFNEIKSNLEGIQINHNRKTEKPILVPLNEDYNPSLSIPIQDENIQSNMTGISKKREMEVIDLLANIPNNHSIHTKSDRESEFSPNTQIDNHISVKINQSKVIEQAKPTEPTQYLNLISNFNDQTQIYICQELIGENRHLRENVAIESNKTKEHTLAEQTKALSLNDNKNKLNIQQMPNNAVQLCLEDEFQAEMKGENLQQVGEYNICDSDKKMRNNDSSQEERRNRSCKICLDEGDSKENGRLLTPCQCIGTCKWIHEQCLKDWILSKHSNSNKEIKRAQCEICKHFYLMSYRTEQVCFCKTVLKNGGVRKVLKCVSSFLCLLVLFSIFAFLLTVSDFSGSMTTTTTHYTDSQNNSGSTNIGGNSSSISFLLLMLILMLIIIVSILLIVNVRDTFFRRCVKKWQIFDCEQKLSKQKEINWQQNDQQCQNSAVEVHSSLQTPARNVMRSQLQNVNSQELVTRTSNQPNNFISMLNRNQLQRDIINPSRQNEEILGYNIPIKNLIQENEATDWRHYLHGNQTKYSHPQIDLSQSLDQQYNTSQQKIDHQDNYQLPSHQQNNQSKQMMDNQDECIEYYEEDRQQYRDFRNIPSSSLGKGKAEGSFDQKVIHIARRQLNNSQIEDIEDKVSSTPLYAFNNPANSILYNNNTSYDQINQSQL